MIEEPTKKYKEGETDDLLLPDSLQPEHEATDAELLGPQQLGSQRINSRLSNRGSQRLNSRRSNRQQLGPHQPGPQQPDPQQPGPQQRDTQPPGLNLPSNGNSFRARSANIPLILLTEPSQENPDGEVNGHTQRQHGTDGDNDDVNVTQETEM